MKSIRSCNYAPRVRSILNEMLLCLGSLGLPDLSDPWESRECFSAPPRQTSARDFTVDYLRSQLFAKWEHLKLGIDTKQVALDGFWQSERRCRRVNELWDSGKPLTSRFYIEKMKGLLERVLGRSPPCLTQLPLMLSSGATFDVSRTKLPSDKLNNKSGVTATFALAKATASLDLFGSGITYQLVPGSRLTTVPKSYKTDRVIAVEPTLNGMVQRAYGKYIRRRLLDVAGIDLRIQQEVNRSYLTSSWHSKVATIDFKAASDCISFSVVRDLLPFEWFEALATCSSPRFFYEGTWTDFEKFSSMGNGFTFELETLIFWALAKACGSEIACVFGDDVIVERELETLVTNVGDDLGFEVNVAKTFSSGPFRESCGFDSYNGQSVTPFRVKGRTLRSIDDVYFVHNELLRWSERSPLGSDDVQYIRKAVSQLRSLLPSKLRKLGPDGYGDNWLISNFSEARPSISRDKRGFEGYIVKGLRRVFRKEELPDIDMLYARYMASRRDNFPLVVLPPLRDRHGIGQPSISAVDVGSHKLVPCATLCRDWPELWVTGCSP